ncbi:ABC transporter permease subunit [Kineosporia sp. J2-2]|uniref:ABC transporter permease subunit n=1 Tax=Kineosporia corallincola TaxID=2835133 RepID=A0ABS5TCV9_9ACTN|nr:ABC transporter permease subunit [Kineosporia corallincola]MBT0768919.1 ABC transporter permease subunit [Kineosporia corallincola]
MSGVSRAVLRALAPLLVSAVVAVAAWEAFLRAFDVNPLVGKDPAAVWAYLFTDADAAANRTDVLEPLLVTLKDASLGFGGGLVVALLVAVVFVLSRSVEQAFLPVAMLLRSVPLVAMTPLITLVFGRGLAGVSVIAGIVVFFPALVTVVFGLRSVNPQARDLVEAYGGGRATALRKVALPAALPSLFAAMRISVPGALIGALVAEWLATGKGVGGEILRDIGAFGYDHLWASIIVLTAVSVLLYTVLGLIEQLVLARFGEA